MRPKRYYVSGNKGTETPSNLLFFDTESHWRGERPSFGSTTHTLKLWTAIACRLVAGRVTRVERCHGTTADEFYAFHESRQQKGKPLWSFAHNLGFDLTLLNFWNALESGRYSVGPVDRPPSPKTGKDRKPWTGRLCLEGRPTFAVVRGQHGLCKWVDTGNYWPTSLESIGQRCGLPKLTIDFSTCTDSQLLAYCFRDSEVCMHAVVDLLNRWRAEGCGVFQMTAASLAMTNWRHTMSRPIAGREKVNVVMEPGHVATSVERRGYYGGRVEPFYLGDVAGPVYSLDVNSLYLSQMTSELFPRARVRSVKGCPPAELRDYMHAYGAVADVTLRTPHDTYPVRPHGVQLHACGVFATTLCGPELIRALKQGHVVSVGEAWLYSMDAIFAGWADTWFARKQEALERGPEFAADAEFAKIVGNSLSGKFGQHGEYWRDRPTIPCVMPWGEWVECDRVAGTQTRMRGIAGRTQVRVVGDEPHHSFPAISAYITAYGREYMRRLFNRCPPRSVYYTATDSIICGEEAYTALDRAGCLHQTAIGQLRLKGVYDKGVIRGCNNYQLDDIVVVAGTIARARRDDRGRRVADVWQGLPSIIGRRPDGTVTVAHREIRETDPTPKGVLMTDGWVEPYRLSPDADFTDKPAKKKRARTTAV